MYYWRAANDLQKSFHAVDNLIIQLVIDRLRNMDSENVNKIDVLACQKYTPE
jgi:hypothetical protein